MANTVDQLDNVRPQDLRITKQMLAATAPNNPNQFLHPSGDLWITVHDTANYAATAGGQMHANFVTNSYGGEHRVSYHLTVDDIGAWQMMPLDRKAHHAADGCDDYEGDLGCWASIAIETCVNRRNDPIAWLKVKNNLVALIVAIVTGDPRLDFGRTDYRRFSGHRLATHFRWSDPGSGNDVAGKKTCSRELINEGNMDKWTGAGPIQDAVLKMANQPAFERPRATPEWTGLEQEVGNVVWHPCRRKVTVKNKTTPLAFGSPNAPATGPDLAPGDVVELEWVAVSPARRWYVSVWGSRIDADDFDQSIRFRVD